MADLSLPALPPDPQNILFVCTGNSCRSVYAEGIFKKMIGGKNLKIRVHSAGTAAFPGKQASLRVLQLLKEEGIDLSVHSTRKLSREIIDQSCIIFVMESAQREAVLAMAPESAERVFLLSQFYSERKILPLETEIPDPIGMGHFFYENVNDIIKDCCRSVFSRLKNRIPPAIAAEMQTSR